MLIEKFTKRLILAMVIGCFFASHSIAASKLDKPDGDWVTLTGTVASTVATKGAGFMLDYGDGIVTVEVDDWDMDDDSAGIMPGERVTVNGRMDDSLFESKSIEASTVYVHPRNTYYVASAADEEDSSYYYYYGYAYEPLVPVEGSWVSVTGTVSSVDAGTNEFLIKSAGRELEVETQNLGYDPLDAVGIQKLKKGDRVSVTGILDTDFFDEDDIIATSVTKFSKPKSGDSGGDASS